MSNPKGKRGFVPPQAAASTSALDFAAASQSLQQAFAAARAVRGDIAVADAAEVIAKRADILLSIPTSDPAQIAEKVSAFGWLHNITPGPLSEPTIQDRVDAASDQRAHALMAIYLDLAAPPLTVHADRVAWDAALAEADAAWTVVDAMNKTPTDDDLWQAAWERHGKALEALLNLRAPDGVGMGRKACHILARNYDEYRADDLRNPATISRLLAGTWDETGFASLYQDGLALSGETGPVVTARPDPFDAEEWLVQHGDCLTITEPGAPANVSSEDAGSLSAFRALADWHQDEIATVLDNRRTQQEREERANESARAPTSPQEIRAIFADAAAKTFPEEDRAAVLADLRSALRLEGIG